MSDLYELPNGWEWKTIDEFTTIKSGKRVPKGKKLLDDTTAYPYIRVTDFSDNGTVDTSDIKFISEEIYQQIKNYTITDNDIYISVAGTIGKTGIIPSELNGANLTENAVKIVFDNTKYDKNFIFNFTNSNTFMEQIGLATKTVAMPKLAIKRLKEVQIPLPPLLEQQRIVSKLDLLFEKIDKSIALHQKNMDEADVFMGSVLNDVFGELEDKGLITEKQLNECFIVKDGTHDSPKYVDDGFPLFTSKNLKDYGLDISNFKSIKKDDYDNINKRSKVDKGDLLFAMIGTIGNPTIVDFEPNFAIKNVALFKPIDNNALITYLKYYFMSEKVITKMRNEANGATQKFVGLTYLREFPYPLTNINIQQKVVKYLDEVSEKIAKVKSVQKEKMDSLKALKASILDSAFRGEL